jgi:hypothetical protein
LLLAALLGCAQAPVPEPPKEDPAKSAVYLEATQALRRINVEAGRWLDKGDLAKASSLVKEAEPLTQRLLAAPRPTLEAMLAVSDFDDLYGRTLLKSKNYVWARTIFQKNVARWKNWLPQTEETARRRKLAEAAVAECDRRMAAGGAR